MLLVIPVRSLLFYCAASMSVYSFVSFLTMASPLEIQFMGTILSAASTMLGCIALFYVVPSLFNRIEALEKVCRDYGTCGDCGVYGQAEDAASESSESSHDSHDSQESQATIYYEESRVVEEKDGRLIVTTTFKPINPVEELREMAEAPAEESPVEETTEFADLLTKEAEKKDQ